MKVWLVFLVTAMATVLHAANNNQSVANRWKQAVINVCRTVDVTPEEAHIKILSETEQVFQERGDITSDELGALYRKHRKVVHLPLGTGFIFTNSTRPYLITARHVVEDQMARVAILAADTHPQPLGVRGKIFHRLSMVADLKDADDATGAALHPYLGVYSLTDTNLDLAIIPLYPQTLAAYTERVKPIGMNDIAGSGDLPSLGDEVLTVGYPGFSWVQRRQLPTDMDVFFAPVSSVAMLSFGRIGMVEPSLHYFWCDLSVGPGNSGGPIVAYGKVVGVVTAQALGHGHRLPFARATHISAVLDLLREVEQEEANKLEALVGRRRSTAEERASQKEAPNTSDANPAPEQ